MLSAKEFYLKHILRSDNWYFETVLGVNGSDIIHISDDFKTIVSNELGISFNNIAMVGSGKLGYSLSPNPKKLFLEFNDNEKIRKISDVDIAIVSSQLFQKYWDLFRKSYKPKYAAIYNYIPREIYRGYINENHLQEVEGCRKEWNAISSTSKKSLYNDLYMKHEVTYRLYRSWEDFEEYHIQSLTKIKRGDL
ncbi:MAG: hypothetical protein ACERLG_09855 [Sedimentibacter sp.]